MSEPHLDRLTALLKGLAPRVALEPGGELSMAAGQRFALPTLRLVLLVPPRPAARNAKPVESLDAPVLMAWRADQPAIGWPVPVSARVVMQGRAELAGPMAMQLMETIEGVLSLSVTAADPSLQQAVQLIASELREPRCGGPLLLEHAGDILFIGLLRHLIAQPRTRHGLLNGLSDSRLARALVAVHRDPGKAWTLADLSRQAGMSRTAFATRFRTVMDQTPGAYLYGLRMALARASLQRGQALKQAAAEVGYTPTSLSRALARQV